MQRMTVLPWLAWAFLAAAAIGIVKCAQAAPVFEATAQGVVITLHDEACASDAVTNLPMRATWREGGQTFEGCWVPRPDMGLVLAYFADKTVVAVPMQVFTKVQAS